MPEILLWLVGGGVLIATTLLTLVFSVSFLRPNQQGQRNQRRLNPAQVAGGAQGQGAAAGNADAPNNPAPAGNQGAAAPAAAAAAAPAAPTRRQRAFAWMRSHWLLEVIILGLIGLGGVLLYFYLSPNSTTFEGIGFGESTSFPENLWEGATTLLMGGLNLLWSTAPFRWSAYYLNAPHWLTTIAGVTALIVAARSGSFKGMVTLSLWGLGIIAVAYVLWWAWTWIDTTLYNREPGTRHVAIYSGSTEAITTVHLRHDEPLVLEVRAYGQGNLFPNACVEPTHPARTAGAGRGGLFFQVTTPTGLNFSMWRPAEGKLYRFMLTPDLAAWAERTRERIPVTVWLTPTPRPCP